MFSWSWSDLPRFRIRYRRWYRVIGRNLLAKNRRPRLWLHRVSSSVKSSSSVIAEVGCAAGRAAVLRAAMRDLPSRRNYSSSTTARAMNEAFSSWLRQWQCEITPWPFRQRTEWVGGAWSMEERSGGGSGRARLVGGPLVRLLGTKALRRYTW